MENEWGNSVPSRKIGILKYKDTYSSGLTENVTCFIQKTSLNVTSCVIMVISKACCFELCNIRCTTRGEVSPALFLKSKKVPWFGKKEPKCIPLCVKFSIQNVSFGVSLFFVCFWGNVYWSAPIPQNRTCLERFLDSRLNIDQYW